MKFSIQEEGKDKQIFFTFKEASEKTGMQRFIFSNRHR